MSDSNAVAARVLEASPFVARVARRLPRWREDGLLERARLHGELAARVAEAVDEAGGEPGLMRALRRVRAEEMARIAYRDIAGLATLDETLADLSDLADACVGAALDAAWTALVRRYGEPRLEGGDLARPVVLGMGKLGGRELNFSSDIDLIFAHTGPGTTGGPEVIDNDRFFVRLAQDTCRMLSARTEDGFVFRTDTMLRPFGSAGPMSVHFAYAEDYYQHHGREWERYALIKARPVAGDLVAGFRLLRRLRPFVYRRYLDFGAIDSLRQLKKLIADDVARRRLENNVKLGPGGIRELEFIVQSFQLVRGGQEPRLRDPRLRPVLRELGHSGALPADLAERLDGCYVFLRRVENAIQLYEDQQTHALPQQPAAQLALCRALDMPDWAALTAQLESVQHTVHAAFQSVFGAQGGSTDESPAADALEAVWRDAGDDLALDLLSGLGFREHPQVVLGRLREIRQARLLKSLSEQSLIRLRQLLPLLLNACASQKEPEQVAERVLRVVLAIVGRSTYLSLLRESATAREQLVRLCAVSPWITSLLVSAPALLGSLLDEQALYAAPTREEMRTALSRRLDEFGPDEVEAAMDCLRRFKQTTTLRIAASDVAGALPLVQVSDRLTWLAEVVLDLSLARAYAELATQHGEPVNRDGGAAGFAAIAYGKFGGIELGYASDLDLVFLHDCDQPEVETQGGPRPITASAFFTRLGQRLVHWLSTLTSAGRAYEVDLELRPSGRSGLPVVSFRGFEDYQRHHAWTWEHQALTRARFVAGSPAIAGKFERLRVALLCLPRDGDGLRREVLEMRAKMRAQFDRPDPKAWNIKHSAGGIIDIEFMTQYLLLREAAGHPGVARWSDNWRQLEALAEAGVLPAEQAQRLIVIYRAYRAWAHAAALMQREARVDHDTFSAERAEVESLWATVFELSAAALTKN